jgi:acyl-CoA synthetase (AMP-forming)/AMP-acid ligase II
MTVAAPPKVEFMTDAVAHWAAAQPDAEALTYRETRWTWAQWNDRIGRVAGGLAALGLSRGGRVAFLDKNNPACLEVSLGAGLIGAANAVINWRLAAGELDYVINDSACRLTCSVLVFDMARPPRDDLRVPTTELEDTRRWPWRSVSRGPAVKSSRARRRAPGRGTGWQGSAGSCTGA